MFNYCQVSHWCPSWHTLPPSQAPIQDYEFSFRCRLQTLVLYLEAFPLSSEPERAGQEILHPCGWMLSTPVHLYTEICHHPSSALDASCLGPVASEGNSSPRSVFLGLRLKWICICRLWIHTVEGIQLSEPPEPVWTWMGRSRAKWGLERWGCVQFSTGSSWRDKAGLWDLPQGWWTVEYHNTWSTVVKWWVCHGTPSYMGPEKSKLCLGSFSKAAQETDFHPVVLAV